MHGEPIRQQPTLGRNRIQPVPLVHPQHGEPKLPPRRYLRRATAIDDPLARFRALGRIRRLAEQPHRHVRQNRPKHCTVTFDVQPNAPILVQVILQVSQHLPPSRFTDDLLRFFHDVRRDDQPRHQKHRPAVVARPVSVLVLYPSIILDPRSHRSPHHLPVDALPLFFPSRNLHRARRLRLRLQASRASPRVVLRAQKRVFAVFTLVPRLRVRRPHRVLRRASPLYLFLRPPSSRGVSLARRRRRRRRRLARLVVSLVRVDVRPHLSPDVRVQRLERRGIARARRRRALERPHRARRAPSSTPRAGASMRRARDKNTTRTYDTYNISQTSIARRRICASPSRARVVGAHRRATTRHGAERARDRAERALRAARDESLARARDATRHGASSGSRATREVDNG